MVTAASTHPAISDSPPMGVIGPNILLKIPENIPGNDNRYRDPENNIVPVKIKARTSLPLH